jgi:hypothetical protein
MKGCERDRDEAGVCEKFIERGMCERDGEYVLKRYRRKEG